MPPSYRRSWGGSFTFEPFDRYKQTTETETKFLMGNAVKQAVNRVQATVGDRVLTPVPMFGPRQKDNSPWGRVKRGLDKVTPEIVEEGKNKTLQNLERYGNFTSGGITSLTTRGYIDENGQYQTQRNILGNPVKNVQSHIEAQEAKGMDLGSGLERSFRGLTNAGKAFSEDPDVPAGVKIGVGIASDPTTYIGPGLVRGALAKAPKAIQASKGARFAGAILENPRRATVAASAASIGAGQIAESTGHENLVGPASFVAGLVGGAAAGIGSPRPAHGPAPVSRGLTPAVQNAPPIDLVAKQARELGEAKTPYLENQFRVGNDRKAIAMGRKALISRLDSEVSKKALTPDAAKSARWFLNTVPDKYLERLGSSYVKGSDDATIAAQYVKLNGVDEDDGLIRIVKGVTNRSSEPERVIVHEIGHHLEQFVDDADYMALRNQWDREMGTKGGWFPGSGEGGQALVDTQPIMAKSDAGLPISPAEAEQANAAYRYTGGFGEWFAENIADRAVRDFMGDAEEMGPWKRAWESVKEIAEATYRWLLRRGEKDAAERVYQNILAGKYEAVGRGGGAEVQNLDVTPSGNPRPSRDKKPAIDLFNTIAPEARLAEEANFKGGIRGKVDTAARNVAAQVGGEKFDKNLRQGDDTVFTVKEKTRLDGITRSYEALADDLYAHMLNTGIPLAKGKDGVERLPNGATFPDMFEGKTKAGKAAFAALAPEQKAAIQAMKDFGDKLNANLRYHNQSGTLGWDEAEEAYFPRISIGVDGKARAHVGSGGRALGSTQSFEKSRTYATFEEGLKEGIDYGDSRQAWKIMARAKMRAAADDYIARGLKPLGLTEKQVKAAGGTLGVDYVTVPRDVAPALTGRYFEPETAERIAKALGGSPMIDIKPVRELNKVLTPLRATGDVSWFAQQGAAMLFRHPVKAAEGAAKVIWSATFGDRKTYDTLIAKNKKNLRSHIQHGMQWNEGDELAPIDYGFVKADTVKGRIASKPGVKEVATGYNKVADFSNQTFGRYMNFVRLTFANDAFERLQAMKKTMSPDDFRKEYMGAMDAVNRITGRTNRKVSSLESMAAFAPTYFSASVEQVAAAVAKGGLEGSIARAHIMRMLTFGALMSAGINAANGHDVGFEGGWESGFYDPRSPQFLRVFGTGDKFNTGLDISFMGTYDTLFRALAGTVAGDDDGGPDVTRLWKMAEGKMSPAIKMIYEPLRGRTYLGEPLDTGSVEGWVDIAKKQGVAAAPFSIQNAMDSGIEPAWEEKSLKPLVTALPGEVASFVGTTNSPVTPTEKRNARREELAQEQFGRDYDELSGREKSLINEDPRIQKAQEETDENTLTRDDDRSRAQQASIARLSKVEALTKRFDPNGDGTVSGEITGKEFRENYDDIQNQLRGSRETLGDKGKGDLIDRWFDLWDAAENEDGSTNREKLEQLQLDFRAKHPEIDVEVDKITGTQDNATMRRFRVAQDQAQQYYKLPQYNGLSFDEGKKAGEILSTVSRLVGNDQAISSKQAMAWMVQNKVITPEERTLALRAQKLGKSRERKEFEATHPEYMEFYRDRVATLGNVAAPDVGTYANASSSGGSTFGRGRRTSRRGVDVNNLTRRSSRRSLAS